MNSQLIDLNAYSLPNKKPAIASLYPLIPRNTQYVPFDIYDYNLLFNDEPTKNIIREGKTISCFYIESPGMRNLLKRLKVEIFEMLTAASSVIRPGVVESEGWRNL